ncbi:MAG: hypothetical protein ABS82_00955 [Rhodanobacter sp. SCN 67-45]|nr:MAG: hypothetical protein ABS82_00955 [Rhodanobacter sp. SCN 67-45]
MLHFDGSNGSTTFTDEVGHVWTPLGSPSISTARSKFGGASGLFSGNAAIRTTYHSDFDLLSGAFTIKCFVYHTGAGDHRIFTLGGSVTAGNATTGYHLLLQVDNGSRLLLTLSNGTSSPIAMNSGGALVPLNAWSWVAASVDAGAANLYLNGTRVAQRISPAIVRPSGDPIPCIGRITSQGAGNDWLGNIDEFQIMKGAAEYSGSSITVPTAPFVYP